GSAGRDKPGAKTHRFAAREPAGDSAVRAGMGLLLASGRGGSAGRYQYPVAAVWDRQPDAGGNGADALRGGAVQNEAPALCLGGAAANFMAADLHPDGGLAESV